MKANLAFLGAFVVLGAITAASAQQTDRPQTGTPGTGLSTIYGQGPGSMYGGAVVTATDRFVFVLRGDTLYKFDASNLRLLAQTQLPMGGTGSGTTGTTGTSSGTSGNTTGNGTTRP